MSVSGVGAIRTTYQFGDPPPLASQFANTTDFYEAYRLWHRAQRTGGGDPFGAMIRDEVRRIRKERGV